MAIGFSGTPPTKRRARGRKSAPMAEMNMIPFIDVMLVLLVIFMVAAPLLATGVPVDLPKTSAGELQIDAKPVAVTIDAQGKLFLQEEETTLADLPAALGKVAQAGFEERIYVRGAARIEYGKVAEVLAALKAAGYTRTALVNQPADGN